MRTLGFSIVLAAMLAATVKADFIDLQVTCAAGGVVTGTNFCSTAGDFGTSATASVNASFTLPTSPGPLSLMSSGQGFAKGYYDGTNNNRSAAYNESISIQLTLDTPGSPRPGFYLITGRSSPLAGPDTAFSESIFGFQAPYRGLPLRELPITLGQPFTFTYTQSMSCYDENLNFFCGTNSFSSQFDFHLYEADGVTPVLINLATPEPSTATLQFLSLTALLLLGWRYARAKCSARRVAAWEESANGHQVSYIN